MTNVTSHALAILATRKKSVASYPRNVHGARSYSSQVQRFRSSVARYVIEDITPREHPVGTMHRDPSQEDMYSDISRIVAITLSQRHTHHMVHWVSNASSSQPKAS